MDPHSLLEVLRRLATNYRWSWTGTLRRLLASIPGGSPQVHPLVTISQLTDRQIDQLLADNEFIADVLAHSGDPEIQTDESRPTVAYFSPEFGISALMPQYAGGLGVLAGDHLKAASDSGLHLAGVGLFYRFGAFRQVIEGVEQIEMHQPIEPANVGALDTGVEVLVPLPGREVRAKVWRLAVGQTPLYLLDTDIESNTEHDRAISDRLYDGDEQHRIDQEMVLGIGGARALAALGWDVEVFHLNEGHAGFLVLELVDRVIEGRDLTEAVKTVKEQVVFTTHTPVPAGIDRLNHDTLMPYMELWASRWGVDPDQVWDLGRDPEHAQKFNMAVFCLRTSRNANGVSALHGEVSRWLFSGVPEGHRIGYVTNGVHARTWTAASTQDLFDEVLGSGWPDGDEEAWARVDQIADQQLIESRRRGSLRLAAMMSDEGGVVDPDALIIGFARRFAPYKRANLLFRQRDELTAMLADDDRPVHFVFAGKAHPNNHLAKDLLTEVLSFSKSRSANGRFTFIPDYDIEIALRLVQGCDLWLNTPIPRMEASGTSGEKVALNGGLNCSILDGWWAEMFDGENGWAISASPEADPELRDRADAASAIRVLRAARDEYYESRHQFNERIRHGWRSLGPKVTAARMLRDYESRLYRPD